MVIVIPAEPVDLPVLEASSVSCSLVGDSVLAAAKDAQAVAEAAGGGAQSLNWEGIAAEAADHAMTVLTNAIGDAGSTLWAVVPELDVYAQAIKGLETQLEDFTTQRPQLVSSRIALKTDVDALDDDDPTFLLQVRASSLTAAILVFDLAVEAWSRTLIAAEDAVIAALGAGDTTAEARDFREARSPEMQETIDGLIKAGVLPEELRYASAADLQNWLTNNPAAADALVNGAAPLTGMAATLNQLVNGSMVTSPGADVDAINLDGVHKLFEGLDPESAALFATLYPSLVGNTDGAPFELRELANRVKVIDSLADERGLLDDMSAQHEKNQGGWNWINDNDLEGPLADTKDRIRLYESILNNDRSILFFEPATHDDNFNRTYDGGIAELHGEITSDTKNVGVMVPGTGTNLSNYQGTADRSDSLNNATSPDTAMISWMGGDFPDGAEAGSARHTQNLAPLLSGFSDALSQELDTQDATGAETTYIGHSYGGAIVGMAEVYGLDADRVVHVESAGMGHDVFAPDDLPASQADVDRYSMTTPQDWISHVQGAQEIEGALPDWAQDLEPGHGADPDEFPGTVRLHTGDSAAGVPMSGPGSHSAVFEERSDSWEQIRQVVTGGTVEEYRTPIYREPPLTRWGLPNIDRGVTGWNDDGGTHDVGGG